MRTMSKTHTTRKRAQRTKADPRSSRTSGKGRLTVSLSKAHIQFLKTHCGERRAASVSAYVEALVADAQARAKLDELSAQTALYYNSLSAKESEELSAWGELGESALAIGEE